MAELIDGQLYVFPRPAPKHLSAADQLADIVRPPFHHGRGGPGGWVILHEPEIHFPEPAEPGGKQVANPDLAGWRRERMPKLPLTPYFPLPPDWVCEILSPSTEEHDRKKKMPLYAHNGVRWAWLIDPIARTLELYALGTHRKWKRPVVYRDNARVCAVPFDAIELELTELWEE